MALSYVSNIPGRPGESQAIETGHPVVRLHAQSSSNTQNEQWFPDISNSGLLFKAGLPASNPLCRTSRKYSQKQCAFIGPIMRVPEIVPCQLRFGIPSQLTIDLLRLTYYEMHSILYE
jgi:hypothetical protein